MPKLECGSSIWIEHDKKTGLVEISELGEYGYAWTHKIFTKENFLEKLELKGEANEQPVS